MRVGKVNAGERHERWPLLLRRPLLVITYGQGGKDNAGLRGLVECTHHVVQTRHDGDAACAPTRTPRRLGRPRQALY